jgi:hypothetical protein
MMTSPFGEDAGALRSMRCCKRMTASDAPGIFVAFIPIGNHRCTTVAPRHRFAAAWAFRPSIPGRFFVMGIVRRSVRYFSLLAALLGGVMVLGAPGEAASPACAPGQPCPSDVGGPVLHNLKIVNLYMSSDWDSDNAGFNISKNAINDFTRKLASGSYFAAAESDYGINSVSYAGDYDATGASRVLCPTPSIGGYTDFFTIEAWISCMTSAGPSPINSSTLGVTATTGNIAPPDDDTLYVVYVPKGTNITDFTFGTCDDYGAYHFFTEVPKWNWDCSLFRCIDCFADFCSPLCCACGPFCGPNLSTQRVAYAVVPAECSGGDIGTLSVLATHEIIEAATDPVPARGWIDPISLDYLITGQMLRAGEVADICSSAGAVPTSPVTMSDGNRVAPYWSNSGMACYPTPAVPLSFDVAPFDAGDTRFFTGTGDWSIGDYKAECAQNQKLIGISATAVSPELRAHSALCVSTSETIARGARTHGSSGSDDRADFGTGDWDVGYTKAECDVGELITGISQTSDLHLSKIQCGIIENEVGNADQSCTALIFSSTSDNQLSTEPGDWAGGFSKNQCRSNQYLKGVSSNATTGEIHALLCCDVGPFPH